MSTRSAGAAGSVAGWLSTVAVVLLCGCPSFDYEAGRWACDTNADCPEGHACDVARQTCGPRDGGGAGGGCSLGCDNLLACSQEVSHEMCVAGCGAAGPACEQCLNASDHCSDLSGCEIACYGGGSGGGEDRCDLVCSHLVSCGGAGFGDCRACCTDGGDGCDEWLGSSDCANISQCRNACTGLGS